MKLVIPCLFCILISGCWFSRSVPEDPSAKQFVGREMWTANNLRLIGKQYIYWQNYLTGEIFPAGVSIRIQQIDAETVTFVDTQNNVFVLYWQASGKDKPKVFESEIHKYFTTKDPRDVFKDAPDELIKAIDVGEVKRGFTKQQVLWCWGWPPTLKDPNNKKIWVYRISEWEKRAVRFEKGVVTEIIYDNE